MPTTTPRRRMFSRMVTVLGAAALAGGSIVAAAPAAADTTSTPSMAGSIDRAVVAYDDEGDSPKIHLSGWALNLGDLAQNGLSGITIELTAAPAAGGTAASFATVDYANASLPRADVAKAYPGSGPNHGWDSGVGVRPYRGWEVCARVWDGTPGFFQVGWKQVACVNVTVGAHRPAFHPEMPGMSAYGRTTFTRSPSAPAIRLHRHLSMDARPRSFSSDAYRRSHLRPVLAGRGGHRSLVLDDELASGEGADTHRTAHRPDAGGLWSLPVRPRRRPRPLRDRSFGFPGGVSGRRGGGADRVPCLRPELPGCALSRTGRGEAGRHDATDASGCAPRPRSERAEAASSGHRRHRRWSSRRLQRGLEGGAEPSVHPAGRSSRGIRHCYATSRALVRYGFGASVPSLFLATGRGFPDALAAGAAAASNGVPVLLTDGSLARTDAATANELRALGTTSISVVGGTAVVRPGVASSLGSTIRVGRLAGSDRFATAAAIAATMPPSSSVYLANAGGYADALVVSVLAGRAHAPLLLTPGTCIPVAALSFMVGHGVEHGTVVGGYGVMDYFTTYPTACSR